ncbi:HlyD family secretion protein [Consotaella salsifontis]|uniref:HlyD family secretion protein n=1 Tax=Consotaella salsifontis TaxID=1365950 RepID=A0A1T4RKG3_9HYPH|nr:HlyD family efflux transporter periplasmic adaptor subunit [Consotaella salsifontis]SKA16465.1 HlyD family secretion protein [Consotaella salsifontis]
MRKRSRSSRAVIVVALGAFLGYLAWLKLQPSEVPEWIAASNGRIEATEIDVAAKTAGRVEEITVNDGDFVDAGQVLARLDTETLDAQRREAAANLKRARIGVETAEHQVRQQEAQKEAADALVEQRKAELDSADKSFTRAEELVRKNAASVQQLDNATATLASAKAALAAAEAEVAAAEAAISTAQSGVVSARAEVEAAEATLERIDASIADTSLRAPRAGRVQYRVVQPGEIVGAGSAILNLVDLKDVYMTFFLPTEAAGKVAVDSEVRLVLDAAPQFVVPASVSYVADVAQFTPKTVETAEERQKLTFRVKARVRPELLQEYIRYVKTGLPGMAYVKLDPRQDWPDGLEVKLPDG